MTHLFGLIFAVALLRGSMFILGMDTSFYYDHVAVLIVFGGTLTAAIVTYPVRDLLKMMKAFFRIAKRTPENIEVMVHQIVRLSQAAQSSRSALVEAANDRSLNPYLKDGIELVLSGFSKEDLEDVMTERLFRDREREEVYGSILRTLSKYPPAFGLVGTVLGLVSVMKAVSQGAGSSEIGFHMALALVATLYGLILTNFVLVPMSENLYNKSAQSMNQRELMLNGLLMIQEKRSPIIVQEKLNSFLPPLKRRDLVGASMGLSA